MLMYIHTVVLALIAFNRFNLSHFTTFFYPLMCLCTQFDSVDIIVIIITMIIKRMVTVAHFNGALLLAHTPKVTC